MAQFSQQQQQPQQHNNSIGSDAQAKANAAAAANAASGARHQFSQPTVGDIEHEFQQQQQRVQANSNNRNNTGTNNNNNESAAQIDDAVFIRECVFAMLACDKLQYSHWDQRSLEYSPMYDDCGATPRQRDIYNKFALKLGTVRRRIAILLSGSASSFLQQSLRRAVERQLTSYSRFISGLSDHHRQSQQQSNQLSLIENSNNSSATTRKIGDVQVACLRALPKLNALYAVLQQSESTKGGELVSKLGSLNHHGGEELSRLMGDVYRETVTPLLFMTLQWLTKGACSDPYNEFFVHINASVPESSDRYWAERFALQPSMIPSTFSREQAQGILLVGKNINFLQKCCRVRDWRMKQAIVDAANTAQDDDESGAVTNDNNNGSNTGSSNSSSFDSIISAALADTNASVMKVLNEKFLLVQAFQRARLIYLLANGDFTNTVMDRLDELLAPPANLVSTTAVQDALHAAVASMASMLPACMEAAAPHIVAEISIPASTASTSSAATATATTTSSSTTNSPYSGWDVFSMTLPFPTPYNTFFTSETLRIYRRLFRLLWKVKRAEVELKKAWLLFMVADRKFINSRSTSNNSDARSASSASNASTSSKTAAASAKSTTAALSSSGKQQYFDANNSNNNNSSSILAATLQQDAGLSKQQQRLRQLNAMAFKHLTHFVNNFQMSTLR